MLHGRVVRPPAPGARLTALDDAAVRELPGVVEVVRNGSFIGVVAEREGQATRAAEALARASRWSGGRELPPSARSARWLLEAPARSFLVVDGMPAGEPPEAGPPPAGAARTLRATYSRPYVMHASIGPSAAMARWDDGALTVWSHSQGVYVLRDALTTALGLDPERVRVVHVVGAGCYGHNGADDAAFDAALLARATGGRPVLLKWTRADEHAWEPYGPPAVVEMQASLDEHGGIVDWRHEAWSTTHLSRTMSGDAPKLLAGPDLDPPVEFEPPRPFLAREAGIHRNATPIYAFPAPRIVKHFVESMPIRTSSLRALGAHVNVFAIECFMDELAAAAALPPLEFRLRHLREPRARAVLVAAAEAAGWEGVASGAFGRGTGVGVARYKNAAAYAAVVARIRVDDASAAVILEEAFIAGDVGEVVDPDGVSNQLEGGFLQAASWSLLERVDFDATGITSVDWDSYPILRFGQIPRIRTVLLDRPGDPYLGAGEAAQGPTAAAIANAVRDAIGIAPRDLPLTPERIREAAFD
jgi:CO/xanthine dehydrogenase Mo-binding subunit